VSTNRSVRATGLEIDQDDVNPGRRYLKIMLMRLRIELLSAAKALRGDLLDDFWKIIDDVNELRGK
jgi:hypothetical protein